MIKTLYYFLRRNRAIVGLLLGLVATVIYYSRDEVYKEERIYKHGKLESVRITDSIHTQVKSLSLKKWPEG